MVPANHNRGVAVCKAHRCRGQGRRPARRNRPREGTESLGLFVPVLIDGLRLAGILKLIHSERRRSPAAGMTDLHAQEQGHP